MFSNRLWWDQPPNLVSRLLAEKRAAGRGVIDLTESNPARAGLSLADEEILSPLRDPASLRYEPSPFGLEGTRQAVAQRLATPAERLILTASTSEAYSYLFKLLADPRDNILVPQPSYPLFEYLARLEGLSIRPYPLRYHEGWWMDTRELARQITRHSRAIVVVNPNNPTGSYIKQEELDRITDFCVAHSLALISDEVFFPYVLEPGVRPISAAQVTECLAFTLGGLSKLLGLPQMKLGWIQVSGPAPLVESSLAGLELIADSYLSVSAPVQHAAPAWLEGQAVYHHRLMERLQGNLRTLRRFTDPLRLEGGWYATVRLRRDRSEEDWAAYLLDRHDVLIQPGYFYDFAAEAHAVLSLLTTPDQFAEGLQRLDSGDGAPAFAGRR